MNSTYKYDQLSKETTKSGLKHVRINYQLDYLKSAQKQKFLPRGIADQMKYVSPIHDANLQMSLQNLMNFAGSRIHDLLIIYYTTWSNKLSTAYYSNLANLEGILTPEEFTSYKNKLNTDLAKEKAKAMKISESKLKRDADLINCKYIDVTTCSIPHQLKRRAFKPKNRRKEKKTRVPHNRKRRVEMKGVLPAVNNVPEEKLRSCVINLSTKIEDISLHQLYLFYLGKTFAPTPPLPDYSEFRLDILQFAYKLR